MKDDREILENSGEVDAERLVVEWEEEERGKRGEKPKAPPSTKDKIRGFSCVCVAAFIWVVSSYWVQDLQSQGMTPLLVTSVANSMFTVLLPVAYFRDCWKKRKSGKAEEGEALMKGKTSSSTQDSDDDDSKEKRLKRSPRRRIFLLSLTMWPIWFLCLYIYNWSFKLTSVMANTILSIGGNSLFTYFLELRLMNTGFRKEKLAAILLCIAGTVLWTYGNYRGSKHDDSHKNTLLGNLLCLCSAGLYSVVSIIIGKYLPESGEADMSLFWGYTGLINLSVSMPVNIIGCLTGLNNMQDLPARLYGMVMLKGLMDNLLSNYLWAYAVLFVGPTSANVGMSIETPIVLIIDICTKNANYLNTNMALNITGAITILLGFLGLSL